MLPFVRLLLVAALAMALPVQAVVGGTGHARPSPDRVPLGVLGDSDSHSYQDRVWFKPGSAPRGGPRRAGTLQWTEAVARLRGDSLDLGQWGTWGTRRSFAKLADWVGIPARAPRREDYRYNLALSGATCKDLMHGAWRQAPRLLQVMDEDPANWRRGVVVIRIGTNSFGTSTSLDQIAKDPASPQVQAEITQCLEEIGRAVALIRARHPRTRFVLVGIFDNANWAKYLDRWQEPAKLANIAAGLDRFDDGLRALAGANTGVAFFDDRAWFSKQWGARAADGKPAYRAVDAGGGLVVANTAGDDPRHAVLKDGHAGLVWNALWAQELVSLMNNRLGFEIPPIKSGEIERYVRQHAAPGGGQPVAASMDGVSSGR